MPWLRTVFAATQRSSLQQTGLLCARHQRSALGRRLRSGGVTKDVPAPQRPNPAPHLTSPEPALSFSQRLKALSREYGWTAVGVYFGLSLLDFPFCFLAVRLLGTDRIGHYEHVVQGAFWRVVQLAFPDAGPKSERASSEDAAEATAREGNMGADASIWTQLGLAYIVHKSFIFIRVPLTAAVLPKVVKTLRSWGYNIGQKKPKST
ncbi:DUF1279 superfamily [Pleosporales sp. CAS-2024a]